MGLAGPARVLVETAARGQLNRTRGAAQRLHGLGRPSQGSGSNGRAWPFEPDTRGCREAPWAWPAQPGFHLASKPPYLCGRTVLRKAGSFWSPVSSLSFACLAWRRPLPDAQQSHCSAPSHKGGGTGCLADQLVHLKAKCWRAIQPE